jgi:hypothetical protein
MYIYLFLLSITFLILLNYNTNNLIIKRSNIHGKGLFTNKDLKKNDIIILDVWPYGNKKNMYPHYKKFFHDMIHEVKYLNHCNIKSNSDINFIDNKYILTANKDIKSDNEILIDYDKLHKKYSFIGFSQPNYKKC